MTNQCQHGQLARVCLTCEHEATIAALTADLEAEKLFSKQAMQAAQELAAERDRLREELERALVDAERYRWLRDKARSVDWTRDINGWSWEQHCRIGGQGMDTAIDAAMRKP